MGGGRVVATATASCGLTPQSAVALLSSDDAWKHFRDLAACDLFFRDLEKNAFRASFRVRACGLRLPLGLEARGSLLGGAATLAFDGPEVSGTWHFESAGSGSRGELTLVATAPAWVPGCAACWAVKRAARRAVADLRAAC